MKKLYGVVSDWFYNNIGEDDEFGTCLNVFVDRESADEYVMKHMADEYDYSEEAVIHILELDVIGDEKWGFRVTLTPISKV